MNKRTLRRLMPPGWNQRVFSAQDFDLLCEAEGIYVFDCAMPVPGASVVYDDCSIILLNRELRGPHRLRVGLHEYGHLKLHAPGVHNLLNIRSRLEFEANLVAACMLIPFPLLATADPWDLVIEHNYAPDLVSFRLMVWRVWGV